MDSSSDNEHIKGANSPAPAEDSALPSANRRRFAKSALVGSAVLLSLANRSAWGQSVPDECLSMPTWNSYTPGFGFASYDPNNAAQAEKLTKAERIVKDGLDDTSFPGYACPIAQEADIKVKFWDKKDRQRDKFTQ